MENHDLFINVELHIEQAGNALILTAGGSDGESEYITGIAISKEARMKL